MTQIRGVNWDYPLSKAEIENVNPNADDTEYYYDNNGGTVNVDMSTAKHHIVQLWGKTDFTITLSGTLTQGNTLKIGHSNAGEATKFTVSGKEMYVPSGANATSHTFTGGGWVEMTAPASTSLMVIAGGTMNGE